MSSRVELFEEIRRDRRVEALSIRELAERHKVHRRAVRQALASALPPPRKPYVARSRPATDPWAGVIDAWLIGDKDVHRNQRHTARRVWQRLVAEHGAVVSEGTVSRYVARRRVELDLVTVEVYIPQTHEPGAEAEVDFGEFYTTIGGALVKRWMFVMRLSHCGRAFHVAYGTQAQEAFLEGHVLAFAHFGGVPGRIRLREADQRSRARPTLGTRRRKRFLLRDGSRVMSKANPVPDHLIRLPHHHSSRHGDNVASVPTGAATSVTPWCADWAAVNTHATPMASTIAATPAASMT